MNYKEFLTNLANSYDTVCNDKAQRICYICYVVVPKSINHVDEIAVLMSFKNATGVSIHDDSLKEHVKRLIDVDVKSALEEINRVAIALSNTHLRKITGSKSEDENELRRDWLRHIASLM